MVRLVYSKVSFYIGVYIGVSINQLRKFPGEDLQNLKPAQKEAKVMSERGLDATSPDQLIENVRSLIHTEQQLWTPQP